MNFGLHHFPFSLAAALKLYTCTLFSPFARCTLPWLRSRSLESAKMYMHSVLCHLCCSLTEREKKSLKFWDAAI